jgi:large subunit ribosomal protein L35
MKTHKSAKKRFRVTAKGKLKRSQAGKKHLNFPKSRKRKRQLRGGVVETGRVARKYVRLLGEGGGAPTIPEAGAAQEQKQE